MQLHNYWLLMMLNSWFFNVWDLPRLTTEMSFKFPGLKIIMSTNIKSKTFYLMHRKPLWDTILPYRILWILQYCGLIELRMKVEHHNYKDVTYYPVSIFRSQLNLFTNCGIQSPPKTISIKNKLWFALIFLKVNTWFYKREIN